MSTPASRNGSIDDAYGGDAKQKKKRDRERESRWAVGQKVIQMEKILLNEAGPEWAARLNALKTLNNNNKETSKGLEHNKVDVLRNFTDWAMSEKEQKEELARAIQMCKDRIPCTKLEEYGVLEDIQKLSLSSNDRVLLDDTSATSMQHYFLNFTPESTVSPRQRPRDIPCEIPSHLL